MGLDIQWEGPACTGEELAQVEKELRENLADVDHPSGLIFHTVLLGKDRHGPSVMVWGKPGHDCYFAKRHAKTKWVSIDEL